MNAAARLVHQNIIARHLILTSLLTKKQISIVILALGILLSALGVINTTHNTRMLHNFYQQELVEKNRLLTERSQLLLERSTWMVQERTQEIAVNQLGMMVPERKSVVIVRES